MPLGTLDRSAPPLFNQGPSALSKLAFFSALALFLMVADARFQLVKPLRTAVGAVLYPVQWLALKPVQLMKGGGQYLEDLQTAQQNEADARKSLALQAQRASQADTLLLENARLRALLALREGTVTPSRAAEVLYDAADPYTRKIVIDQGLTHGIAPGSPVIDENGVLGQVTQAQPFTSEITLVIDRNLSVPVQNARTGARSLAFGDPSPHGSGMELRFMAANTDVQEGDLLATSGVDGVYPAGLPVARVTRIERRADSGFARIHGMPFARVTAARYVLVLTPTGRPPDGPPEAVGAAASTTVPAARNRRADAAEARADARAERRGAGQTPGQPAGRTP